MRIGILGSGRMARSVARACAGLGHRVRLGSSDPERARAASSVRGGLAVGTHAQAAEDAELVVLASLWHQVPAVLAAAGSLQERVLLDVSNPEPETGTGLVIGHTTSGSEEVAALSGARVVKALNHVYAELLDTGGDFGGVRATGFYCGDDATAKAVVHDLIGALGLDPVDAGPLSSARFLEPLAALMVVLVRRQGAAPADVAAALLRRQAIRRRPV